MEGQGSVTQIKTWKNLWSFTHKSFYCILCTGQISFPFLQKKTRKQLPRVLSAFPQRQLLKILIIWLRKISCYCRKLEISMILILKKLSFEISCPQLFLLVWLSTSKTSCHFYFLTPFFFVARVTLGKKTVFCRPVKRLQVPQTLSDLFFLAKG